MRSRNPQAPAPSPPQPTPARAVPRSRRLWLGRFALGLLVGLAAWGAWSLWRTDPLGEVRAALDRRDFRAADELLAKRLAAHPDDREARLLAVRAARRGGDLARAFDQHRAYTQQHRADEASELELALIRAQGGNISEAERLFAAYSGRPESPDAPFVMEAYLEGVLKVLAPDHEARIDPDTGDPTVLARLDKAVSLWLAARSGNADQVQGLIWQGRASRYARDLHKSIASFREALARDPDHFDARYHLAMALGQEAPAELVRHLEVLHDRRPEDRRLSYSLAAAYRALGRLTEARRLLTAMIDADARELSALIELGLLNLDEGKVAEAESLLRRALDLAPDAPETNIAMSRCQQLAGRPGEAARYRKRFDEIEVERKKQRPAGKP